MSNSEVDLRVAVAQTEGKKKNLPRSERDKDSKECPNRSPVKVYKKDKKGYGEHQI